MKSLQYFINRSAAIAQYRDFLRILKPIRSELRFELLSQIRLGFHKNRNIVDPLESRKALQYGREQLKQLKLMNQTIAPTEKVHTKWPWE